MGLACCCGDSAAEVQGETNPKPQPINRMKKEIKRPSLKSFTSGPPTVTQEMKAQFRNETETTLLSANVAKFSSRISEKEKIRTLVVTQQAIYTFTDTKVPSRNSICNVNAIIQSKISNECVFHKAKGKDLYIKAEEEQTLFDLVKLVREKKV